MATRPRRPKVYLGASLIIAAGVLLFYGVFLAWAVGSDGDSTGLSEYHTKSGVVTEGFDTGQFWMLAGVVLIGLGVTLFLAGRIVAVAIVALVLSALSIFLVQAAREVVSGEQAYLQQTASVSEGFGITLGMLAVPLALTGCILVLANRPRAGALSRWV